jgi:hypothetical protein
LPKDDEENDAEREANEQSRRTPACLGSLHSSFPRQTHRR